MTDRLPPERVAELRRIATGEDWSPPTPQDLGALLGEIDRLAARHRLEHERAETLEAENAKLAVERDELARILREAVAESGLTFDELQAADADKPTAATVGAARHLRDTLTAWLDSALDATLPQSDAQRAADGPAAASAQSEPPEAEREPQRPAEDFRTYRCPTPCDSDCEARCHEGHQVGYKQTHDIAECQARSAAAEAYRRLAPKPIDADQRAYCPDCGHPETNCACG